MFETTFTPEQIQKLKDLAWENNTDINQLLREALDDFFAKNEAKKKMADGKTVMLVDDSTFMRTALREMVQKHGYKVLGEAENGKLGAQYYNNFLVDYILLGIQMPVMDGMDFLKQIDKRDECRVIVVTAACHVKTVLEAIEYGADYFIIKPFSATQMIDVLSMHESEYFSAESLEEYSNYFYRTKQYTGDTKLSQADIDELREFGFN
jgi:two-component system chemotaxis response regulator CheY